MADITCPNCKRPNPDFLDVCQFCQTPLKPESTLHIGEKPTKKNTGELEGVLPDWLKDVRQQARELAEEDAAKAAAQSMGQKDEPPDFLAGLASQAKKSDEDEVPDWLASINPVKTTKPSMPASPKPETDFFAQFNRGEAKPAETSEPAQEEAEVPAWMDRPVSQPPASEEKDELSDWFSQASASEPVEFEANPATDETGWQRDFDFSAKPEKEPPPQEPEDLGWLHDLEAAAKKTGELPGSRDDLGWMANPESSSGSPQPSDAAQTAPSSPEDLSWLDTLGRTSEPLPFDSSQNRSGFVQPFDVPEKRPSDSSDDLSWLDKLGGVSEPSGSTAAPFPWEQKAPSDAAPEFDLSSTVPPPAEEKPFDFASRSTPAGQDKPFDFAQDKPATEGSFTEEDLSWLSNLGGTSEPLAAPPFSESMPETPEEKGLPGEEESRPPVRPFSVPTTAELRKDSSPSIPDWLKSATEEPAIPPPGALSMDWFRETDRPAAQEPPLPSGRPEPASLESDRVPSLGESGPLSNQDVDALFSMDMPDWLSQPEGEKAEPTPQPTQQADDSLAPVELPSWVQAMRPVEAVISETAPSLEDQVTEKEGPLAGLAGVIPAAPIGSSRRPKALSFMIQATDEQQKGAALLEQLLAGETNPRPLVTPSSLVPQRALRWALAGLFFLVLGAVLAFGSRAMPVSANPPQAVNQVSDAVLNIPEGSKMLMIVDYEPSLAGEMEAVSGPFLNHLVLLRFPVISFLATSPNGSALVEHLLANTGITRPLPNNVSSGLGYEADAQYFNLGYLPGGAAGVLGFLNSPQTIVPPASLEKTGVGKFSDYSAVVVLTDHAESGRVWIEQMQSLRANDPLFPPLTNQPLLMVTSAQAGPLLQPYVASGQVTGMISGLSDAARYEEQNNVPPRLARTYWDTFGIGLMMSIALIVFGSLWSLFTGIRAQRAGVEQG